MFPRFFLAASLLSASALGGCAVDATDPTDSVSDSGLEVTTLTATTIGGSFTHGGSYIEFESVSVGHVATLHLDINGAELDVTVDAIAQMYTDDGHLNALYAEDIAALLALRDAVGTEYADVAANTLQGTLLVRHADHLAEAPVGYTHDRRVIDLAQATLPAAQRAFADRADADGCGSDGVTCFTGKSGAGYALYDPSSNGTCVGINANYGGKNCPGRCGAGCGVAKPWPLSGYMDNDYTWDCLDHDKCVDAYGGSVLVGNANCGDEFNDAVDDYAATMGALCP